MFLLFPFDSSKNCSSFFDTLKNHASDFQLDFLKWLMKRYEYTRLHVVQSSRQCLPTLFYVSNLVAKSSPFFLSLFKNVKSPTKHRLKQEV